MMRETRFSVRTTYWIRKLVLSRESPDLTYLPIFVPVRPSYVSPNDPREFSMPYPVILSKVMFDLVRSKYSESCLEP